MTCVNHKLMAPTWYVLRWLGWLIRYAVIWPAAMLMLLIILVCRMDNNTPGQIIANEIMTVTRNVQIGEFRIPVCQKPDTVTHSVACTTIITDAKGYAAHIDSSLRAGPMVWGIIAMMSAGLALFLGRYPESVMSSVNADNRKQEKDHE
ncbi:conjugal transfer protein TraP [Buttiauxella ferragutiae]|uniref:conjugal transfer protein TraP n=1 Tax=Buttiauxella ferragutiae TaxID=82989 RepID=UPI003526504D